MASNSVAALLLSSQVRLICGMVTPKWILGMGSLRGQVCGRKPTARRGCCQPCRVGGHATLCWRYTISGILHFWGQVELEPEVAGWLEALPDRSFGQAAFAIDLLARHGATLGEPYTRQLDGKLRELRFYVDGQAFRVSYFIAPGRRVILLTIFKKQGRRERSEIDRARRAMARCLDEGHTAEECK
jgi:hypothetical protein